MPSRPLRGLNDNPYPASFPLSVDDHDAQVFEEDDEYEEGDEAMEVPHEVAMAEDARTGPEESEEVIEEACGEQYEAVSWGEMMPERKVPARRPFCYLCDCSDAHDNQIGIHALIERTLYSEFMTHPKTVYSTVYEMYRSQVYDIEDDIDDWPENIIELHLKEHAPTPETKVEQRYRKQEKLVDCIGNLLFKRNKLTREVVLDNKNHNSYEKAQATLIRIQQLKNAMDKSSSMMI